ncbi:hypothetical protein BGZ91_002008 [Linnemannia elongata]|nr:hypothetical protein BGZ91_002008 [Linnemannia elongata]
MRSIPVGFVSQSVTSMTTTVASTTAAITTKEPQNGVTTVYSAPTTVVSSTVTNTAQAPQVPAKTVDENSWLRARIAQVQRQDNDTQGWRQPKRPPVKAQQGGSMSLNDEYEVARPNEYEEFKELFENDRRQLEEEKRNFGRHGTGSGSRHYSRSRSRSRSSSPYRLRSRDNRSRSLPPAAPYHHSVADRIRLVDQSTPSFQDKHMALSQLVRHPTSLWQDQHQNMANQDNIEAGVGVGVGVEAGTGEGVAAEAHIADGRVGHAPGQDHVRHPTGPDDPPVLPTNEADSTTAY